VATTQYKFTSSRLIALWFYPAFFLVLIAVVIYSKMSGGKALPIFNMVALAIFFVAAVGPFVFLFFNHLALAKKTVITIADKNIQVTQADTNFSASFDEIKTITEYSSKSTPWSFIIKWEIQTVTQQVTISSLTISKYNFQNYFSNKIVQEATVLPKI